MAVILRSNMIDAPLATSLQVKVRAMSLYLRLSMHSWSSDETRLNFQSCPAATSRAPACHRYRPLGAAEGLSIPKEWMWTRAPEQ